MSQAIPQPQDCCKPCESPTTTSVPGPEGAAGAAGANGTNGANAFTTTSAEFTVPAVGANVTVTVGNSTWMTPTQNVYVGVAGEYEVQSKPSTTQVILKNLGYSGNAAPGTPVAPASQISPSGKKGSDGSLTGAAGGDLTGTYPNPTIANLAVTDAKVAAANKDGAAGTPSMRTLGGGASQACAGNDSRLSDSRNPTGAAGGDLTGTYPNPTLAAAGAGAGTVGDADNIPTLTTDAKGRVTARSNVASPRFLKRYGLLGVLTGADFNTTNDQQINIGSSRYIIRRIVAENASINLTTAQGGIYTGANKTGTTIVAAAQAYTALSSSSKFLDLTLAATPTTDVITAATLYFSLTVAQGAAATGDVYVFGERLD